jgi:hypothetical protein
MTKSIGSSIQTNAKCRQFPIEKWLKKRQKIITNKGKEVKLEQSDGEKDIGMVFVSWLFVAHFLFVLFLQICMGIKQLQHIQDVV